MEFKYQCVYQSVWTFSYKLSFQIFKNKNLAKKTPNVSKKSRKYKRRPQIWRKKVLEKTPLLNFAFWFKKGFGEFKKTKNKLKTDPIKF